MKPVDGRDVEYTAERLTYLARIHELEEMNADLIAIASHLIAELEEAKQDIADLDCILGGIENSKEETDKCDSCAYASVQARFEPCCSCDETTNNYTKE